MVPDSRMGRTLECPSQSKQNAVVIGGLVQDTDSITCTYVSVQPLCMSPWSAVPSPGLTYCLAACCVWTLTNQASFYR